MSGKCLACGEVMPEWRIRDKRVNCSKKCSIEWRHFTQSKREKLRKRKYNSQSKQNTSQVKG